MPKFSIVIPVYNQEAFLDECLGSVLSQDFADFEVVAVDDASTDGSLAKLESHRAGDPRVRIVGHEANLGRHLARKSGTLAAEGEIVVYLDSDDALAPGFLSTLAKRFSPDADVFHFGVAVESETDFPYSLATFESHVNTPLRTLDREGALTKIFREHGGYVQDWRTTQRAYRASLAKAAFSAMADERLQVAEDAYETFALMERSRAQQTDNSFPAYVYHIGRGVNNTDLLGVEEHAHQVAYFAKCYRVCLEYASERDLLARSAAAGIKVKLLDFVGRDWNDKLVEADKAEGARRDAEVVGADNMAAQVARIARDLAGASWAEGDLEGTARAERYLEIAADLAGRGRGAGLTLYNEYRAVAQASIDKARSAEEWKKRAGAQRTRIFVSAHREADRFDSAILQTVQVGSAAASTRLTNAWRDDEGDNISDLNPLLCELTTQYWAWKNVDADRYGFCHYRRYFDFSPEERPEAAYGEIMDATIDAASQSRYCLDDATIEKIATSYDVVTSGIKDLRRFPEGFASVRDHYEGAPRLHVRDLDKIAEIVKQEHPDYAEDVDRYLGEPYTCFCNMFIMRKDLFGEYCAWLFPLLMRYISETDFTRYSKEALRTPGHLAERLLNIYLVHLKRTRPELTFKELQCVHFVDPAHGEYIPHLSELVLDEDSPYEGIVPVTFAADGNYVPMLTTTVYSMLENACPGYFYDIIVLQKGMGPDQALTMTGFFDRFPNASVRFVAVEPLIARYNLSTSNSHISNETYYRFLVQDLMPWYDKVLYLDSDLIVKGDVAELFATDLGDNLVAAAHDPDFLGTLNMRGVGRLDYAKDVLGMKDPYGYFQAGVLILNTREMRKLHTVHEWLEIASNPDFLYNDQDVLNKECEGRVLYLDYAWNVMVDCRNRINNYISHAPAQVYDAYMESRTREKIVHYAGCDKPWNRADCDRFDLYWEYARETPYREKLLALLARNQAEEVRGMVENTNTYLCDSIGVINDAIAGVAASVDRQDPPLARRAIEKLLPPDTRRRRIASKARRIAGI